MNNKEYVNLYEVLELEPGASKEEIQKAYKALVKKYHPDRFQKPADKKQAEEKFKLIKEVYDYLTTAADDPDSDDFIQSDSFRRFFEDRDEEEFLTENFSSPEFLKFLFDQNNAPPKKETTKTTSTSNKTNKAKPKDSKKTSTSKGEGSFFRSESIKFFEKYIAEKKLPLINVFKYIYNNKPIVNSTDDIEDADQYNYLLVREVFYRQHIKQTPEYQNFVKLIKYYKDIDIHATLVIDEGYNKNKFEQTFTYQIKSICEHCSGSGCEKCEKGVKLTKKTTKVKIDQLLEGTSVYEIKNGGNASPLGNGKLIVDVVYHKKPIGVIKVRDLTSELSREGYVFTIKSKLVLSIEPVVNASIEAYSWTVTQVKQLWNLMLTYPHYFALYGTIVLLVVVIICLAILL